MGKLLVIKDLRVYLDIMVRSYASYCFLIHPFMPFNDLQRLHLLSLVHITDRRSASLASAISLPHTYHPAHPTPRSRIAPQFIHSGGGVAVRYENYEKQLRAAGHETRVLCPNRRTVDTWILRDDGYITSSCMKGFPMIGLTFSNARRFIHCWHWCDVCICPEVRAP